jgi:hypothetical protein
LSGGQLIIKTTRLSLLKPTLQVFSLSELEDFIKKAKSNYGADFTGLRLYFVRYTLSADTAKIKTAGSSLSHTVCSFSATKVF